MMQSFSWRNHRIFGTMQWFYLILWTKSFKFRYCTVFLRITRKSAGLPRAKILSAPTLRRTVRPRRDLSGFHPHSHGWLVTLMQEVGGGLVYLGWFTFRGPSWGSSCDLREKDFSITVLMCMLKYLTENDACEVKKCYWNNNEGKRNINPLITKK